MKTLRLLVVIANYGTKNDVYLHRLLEEYRSLPYEVHVVVLTNTPKSFDSDTEVVIEQPKGDPWTFPFAHKQILADRINDYDLFIYSEDDTLITERNITAFLNVTRELKSNEIAGFLRVEQPPNGQQSISTVNSHFHWDPTSVVNRGEYKLAFFSNEHAASYILTREQLQQAIASGGFAVSPHQEKYDYLVTAATDPYTQCGFRKLICISHIDDFLIAHLPNKYIGQLGIGMDDFQRQLDALIEIDAGLRPATALLDTETRLKHLRWSKSFYEPSREDIISALPKGTQTVLSYGCGSAALESDLKQRGLTVTAIPLDSVVGACAEAKDLEVIYGDQRSALKTISGRRFDAVLVLDVLHLVPEPIELLKVLTSLTKQGGSVIATVPNIASLRSTWKRLRGDASFSFGEYNSIKVHATDRSLAINWFNAAKININKVDPKVRHTSRSWLLRNGNQLFSRWLATEFVIRGTCENARYDGKSHRSQSPVESVSR